MIGDDWKRKIPVVKICCCGCTLYTGALLIGIFELVTGIFTFLSCVTMASAAYQENFNETQWTNPDEYKAFIASLPAIRSISIFLSIYYSVVIIIASILLHGIRTRIAKLFWPWLIATPFRMLLSIITTIVWLTSANPGSSNGYGSLAVSQALWDIFDFFLMMYFLIVVYSHYTEVLNPAGESYLGRPPIWNPEVVPYHGSRMDAPPAYTVNPVSSNVGVMHFPAGPMAYMPPGGDGVVLQPGGNGIIQETNPFAWHNPGIPTHSREPSEMSQPPNYGVLELQS